MMDLNNYASLEASKRLVDNGIVLETEAHHIKYGPEWELKRKSGVDADYGIPAPSMAETWRELPEVYYSFDVPRGNHILLIGKSDLYTFAGYGTILFGKQESTNPTDTLIGLLIWVKKEADDGRNNR